MPIIAPYEKLAQDIQVGIWMSTNMTSQPVLGVICLAVQVESPLVPELGRRLLHTKASYLCLAGARRMDKLSLASTIYMNSTSKHGAGQSSFSRRTSRCFEERTSGWQRGAASSTSSVAQVRARGSHSRTAPWDMWSRPPDASVVGPGQTDRARRTRICCSTTSRTRTPRTALRCYPAAGSTYRVPRPAPPPPTGAMSYSWTSILQFAYPAQASSKVRL